MAVNANYPKPQFQDPLRSKPPRTAFEEIQSDVNDLQHQIDIIGTAASGSETVNARDYHTSLRARLRSASTAQGNVLITGGNLVEQDTPDMTLKIKAFEAIVDGVACVLGYGTWTRATATITITELSHGLSNGSKIYIDVSSSTPALALGEYTVSNVTTDTFDVTGVDAGASSGTCEFSRYSGTVTAPGSNTRLDYVVINSDNTVSILAGTASATPVFPTYADTQLVLGPLVVKSTTTSMNYGVEIIEFKKANNQYFPNLYINTTYTATNKYHNNVIVDLSGAEITGTLECQGNCWVVNYDNPGTDGTGETGFNIGSAPNFPSYAASNDWTLKNADTAGVVGQAEDTLNGSVGGELDSTLYSVRLANAGTSPSNNLIINAFNIYINNIDLSGGDGGSGTTEYDVNTSKSTFPDEEFYVGTSGRNGSNAKNITFISINELKILTGGSINITGGNGGNGANASSGTVGNLGGAGGDSGSGGSFTYTTKTYTNNGTISQIAGSAGTGGTGSGGSDNNSNGSNGGVGSDGTTSQTLYDYTDGLPSTYADWIHPLYMKEV